MIYVECYPDTILVRTLTGLPQREVIHELKGKSGVVGQVSKRRDSRGLVDEDPMATPPPYLVRMEILQDVPARGLRLLQDTARGNHIVVLRPRLEDWIARAARDAGIDLLDYNLPTDPRKLHQVINDYLPSYQRLVEDLKNSNRLEALHRLLNI